MSAVKQMLGFPIPPAAAAGARPEREVRDDERRRIGRELHDSTSQLLVALQMSLASLKRQLPSASRRRLFLELDATLNELHQEVRAVAFTSSAPTICAGELPNALKTMSSKVGRAAKLDIEFTLKGQYLPLSARIESSLFRIAQEALANVWRHAHARRVRLSLRLSNTSLSLIVQDDGIGIPRNLKNAGLGLTNIRERVDEFGGRLKVQRLSDGTRIAVTVNRLAAA